MKQILLSLLCSVPMLCFGQILLYNDGAMVKVQPGATLFVEGGIQNTATGTIDNDGTIELQGNFINAGTWEPSQPNTLKFSGTGNSDVTSGTAVFQTVVDAKVGNNMTLLDSMTINTLLDFTSTGATKIVLGNLALKLGNTATVTGYDSDEFVATTGTGVMQKGVTANGSFEFPIGDVTNYSPLISAYTGSAYSSARVRARVIDATHPNKPTDATDFISRYWKVAQSGITAYNNTLTGTYIPADVNGTAALTKGAVYNGTLWSYADAAATANKVIGSTTAANADYTGTNFFGAVNIMAFLQGPFSGGVMATTLNSSGLIPATSPYPDAPTSAVPIPSGVVDWVKLELRDIASPTTVIGVGSAFVKSNGAIVGLDGTSLPRIKNGSPNALIAVFHRNHLPFRTDVGVNTVSPVLIDFTTDTTSVYSNNLDNAPLNTVTAKFVMWPCDATGTTLFVNSGDLGFVKLTSATLPTGYLRADVNLNGVANSGDLGLTKLISAIPKSADF